MDDQEEMDEDKRGTEKGKGKERME